MARRKTLKTFVRISSKNSFFYSRQCLDNLDNHTLGFVYIYVQYCTCVSTPRTVGDDLVSSISLTQALDLPTVPILLSPSS